MDNFLNISNSTHYGKLLGGCVYAGLPLDTVITIQMGNNVYVELNCYMFITEELDYYVNFCWDDCNVCDWKNCKFKYMRDDLKKIISQVSEESFNWEEDSFLGVSLGSNIMTDEPRLTLNGTHITITNENSQKIKQFLIQFVEQVNKFANNAETLYVNRQETIGWTHNDK